MKTFAAASACALALLVAGTASAEDYRIPFGDLDLGSAQGAAQFDRRVARAARAACDGRSPLAEFRCEARVRADIVGLLPYARRDDYARARHGRDQARTPADPA